MDENDKARDLMKQAARFWQLRELSYGRRHRDWPDPPPSFPAAGISVPRGAARDHSSPASAEGQPKPDPGADAIDAAASEVPKARTHLPRRLIIVVVLALASLATGMWAIVLFPDRPPIINPTPFTIMLVLTRSDYTLGDIYLDISPSTGSVKVTASTVVESAPSANKVAGVLTIYIYNNFPVRCSSGAGCHSMPGQTFMMVPISARNSGRNYTATIEDPRFGFTSNGESAIAELPAVAGIKIGKSQSGSPNLLNVKYVVRNPDTYDWSLPPTLRSPGGSLTWTEPLSNSFWETEPTEITGTNHQAQAQDVRDTFVAGILLGVAGGAAIAAVQEGLHMLLDNRNDSKLPKPS